MLLKNSLFFNMSNYFFSMEGGELFERIQKRAEQPFTERGKKILLLFFLIKLLNYGLIHSKSLFGLTRNIS